MKCRCVCLVILTLSAEFLLLPRFAVGRCLQENIYANIFELEELFPKDNMKNPVSALQTLLTNNETIKARDKLGAAYGLANIAANYELTLQEINEICGDGDGQNLVQIQDILSKMPFVPKADPLCRSSAVIPTGKCFYSTDFNFDKVEILHTLKPQIAIIHNYFSSHELDMWMSMFHNLW